MSLLDLKRSITNFITKYLPYFQSRQDPSQLDLFVFIKIIWRICESWRATDNHSYKKCIIFIMH